MTPEVPALVPAVGQPLAAACTPDKLHGVAFIPLPAPRAADVNVNTDTPHANPPSAYHVLPQQQMDKAVEAAKAAAMAAGTMIKKTW